MNGRDDFMIVMMIPELNSHPRVSLFFRFGGMWSGCVGKEATIALYAFLSF